MFKEYTGKNVTFMSCSDCNTKCKHCYISYKGNFSGEELNNLAKQLMTKHERIVINGTEPLIHPEFYDTYKLVGQYGAVTNGLVFKDNYDLIDKLKELGFKEIRISYHFSMHDKISLVPASYLKDLFKEINKRGLEVFLMCSITSNNYKLIPQFCEEALRLGARAVKFTNMLSQGNAKNIDQALILKNEQIDEALNIIDECRNRYDENILKIYRCGSFGPSKKNPKKFCCPAGKDRVCVTPDKKVYPCVFLSKPGHEIGYLENGKIYIDENFKGFESGCMALKELNGVIR